ncbi:hypothetical protein SAY86_022488 [Trapa natans]|uniref:Nuclear speckle splicing regulatory protein 1 N-terminal domain-containing protein n=1 Tax=Trapa natans TaxID=22666 RepID=A0AAN7M5N6_TRANT|nr:hypothetical protein SAY86_022488 [Trapa natans]
MILAPLKNKTNRGSQTGRTEVVGPAQQRSDGRPPSGRTETPRRRVERLRKEDDARWSPQLYAATEGESLRSDMSEGRQLKGSIKWVERWREGSAVAAEAAAGSAASASSSWFRDEDYDAAVAADRALSRQTIKRSALKEIIEEKQKKALEEDPMIFDYGGEYDEMKQKVARPRAQDREEKKVTKKSDPGYESNKPEKNPEYSKPAEKKDEVAPDALEASLHLSPGSSSREEHLEARERDNVGAPSIPKTEPMNWYLPCS